MTRFSVAVAAALFAVHDALALAPWVTDEEREFVKSRVSRIETIPGTPESDAKRFYKVGETSEYVEFNYDESKAGVVGVDYALEDPLVFADGRRIKDASEWPSRRKEILELFEREVYGRMPPAPETVAGEMLSEKLTEDRFAVERRYRVWFREDKTGPFIDWLVHVPRYAPKPCPVILHLNYKGNDSIANEGRTNHYVLPFGKAALLAAAYDERFAVCVPNDDGFRGSRVRTRNREKGGCDMIMWDTGKVLCGIVLLAATAV